MRQSLGRMGRNALLVVLVGLLVSLDPSHVQVASAHAHVVRADPAPNSVLLESPPRVTIWFTEPLEPGFSEIQVLGGQGQRMDNGDSVVDSQDPTRLSVSLPPLPDGTYTVAWKNVSTVDGHKVRGSFLFSIGQPISAASAPAPATPDQPLVQSPLEPIWRWLTLLSILAVVGGLGFELWVLRPVLMRPAAQDQERQLAHRLAAGRLKFTWVALGLFLVASIGQLMVQASTSHELPLLQTLGRPLGEVSLGTTWGQLWLWRVGLLVPLALALGLGGVAARRSEPRPGATTGLAANFGLLAGAGVLLTTSLTSHAAASAGIRTAAVLNDYLHLLAASLWVGGLFHLALGLPLMQGTLARGERRAVLSALVPRFSTLAVLSVGTLLVTGLYSSWAQVTILPALRTPYGMTLLVKLGLVLPLLALGALNWWWVSPRLASQEEASRWLRRLVSGEAMLAVLVLLSVGWLTALEPARQVASRQGVGQQRGLTFRDTVEGANIVLEIEPGQVGPNRFLVSLKDRRGQLITNASDVSLRVSYLRSDLGESPVSATSLGDGGYLIEAMPLSIAGSWQVELVVRRPDAFDARSAFRFEVAPASAASSATIAPAAEAGLLLAAAGLVVLGFLFLGVGLPRGGWRTRKGAAVALPGVVAILVGASLAISAWLTVSGRQEATSGVPAVVQTRLVGVDQTEEAQRDLANPLLPDAASLATGQRVYRQTRQPCHGPTGRGDGPQAKGQIPPPVDLLEHLSLHPDQELFRIAHDGLVGSDTRTFGDRYSDEEIWHLVNYLGIFEDEQHLAEKLYYQGLASVRQGDNQAALASFNEAIELSPDYAAAYNGRAMAYRQLEDYQQAVADHSRAIELHPGYADAYYQRGVTYDEAGDVSQAILDYDRAIELEPDLGEAYYSRGLAYGDTGDMGRASLDFDRALEIVPQFPGPFLYRGLAYYATGDPEQAVRDLRRYLELAPEAEDRAEIGDLVARLEAQLASQAGQTSVTARLTLADLPPGFRGIDPAELGLAAGGPIPGGSSIETSFAFGEMEHLELVWGLTARLPGRLAQSSSDAELGRIDELLVPFLKRMGATAVLEREVLQVPADLGEAAQGTRLAFSVNGRPTHLEALHFGKGDVEAFIFAMYPDAGPPVVPIGELALN